MKYSPIAKAHFIHLCDDYERALKAGDKKEIINLSLVIQSRKGTVPKNFRRIPNRIFNSLTSHKKSVEQKKI